MLPDYGDRKQDSSSRTTIPKDISPVGVENVSPFLKDPEELDVSRGFKELKSTLNKVIQS